MKVDKNEFFREASVLICSSLDFCKSLGSSLEYLSSIMPVDRLVLNVYQKQCREVWAVVFDRQQGQCQKNFYDSSIDAEVQTCLDKYAKLNRKGVLLYKSSEKSPLGSLVTGELDCLGRSVMVMHLNIEDQYMGSLVVIANEGSLFTEEHAELIGRLNEPFGISLANALAYNQLNMLKEQLAADNRSLTKKLNLAKSVDVIGAEGGLKHVMTMVEQIAQLDNTVLLIGETGSGKEIIANAIHQASPRRNGPLVKVNCGAIPESLVDSELFGHEKGAFTGAASRKLGRFERAHGGTIMLDEIGELPPSAQVRLLRVLQTKEIERVGGTEPIAVDIRVVAATHRNLWKMVSEGAFRKDLWFRLNIFPIEIPPLRQRREDIMSLLHYFMARKAQDMGMRTPLTLADGSYEQLMRYDWPGNVRELENVVERAMIKSRSLNQPLEFLSTLDYLKPSIEQEEATPSFDEIGLEKMVAEEEGGDDLLSLDELVALQIERVLKLTKGKVNGSGGAAEILRIHPSTLRHKMEKLGISYGRDRGV